MEKNNFLGLPVGLRDSRKRAFFAEESGYYSYETPLHCLYHLFDVVNALKNNLTNINVWVISQLFITRPFSEAWICRADRDANLYKILGSGMFVLDDKHIYDLVVALSKGAPDAYLLTRGEVIEEWRLYKARGGEL